MACSWALHHSRVVCDRSGRPCLLMQQNLHLPLFWLIAISCVLCLIFIITVETLSFKMLFLFVVFSIRLRLPKSAASSSSGCYWAPAYLWLLLWWLLRGPSASFGPWDPEGLRPFCLLFILRLLLLFRIFMLRSFISYEVINYRLKEKSRNTIGSNLDLKRSNWCFFTLTAIFDRSYFGFLWFLTLVWILTGYYVTALVSERPDGIDWLFWGLTSIPLCNRQLLGPSLDPFWDL